MAATIRDTGSRWAFVSDIDYQLFTGKTIHYVCNGLPCVGFIPAYRLLFVMILLCVGLNDLAGG